MLYTTTLENTVYKLIGTKLKKLRLEKDLTQDDIAQIIGSSKASIANYEKGDQAIYISDIYKIAFHFNIDILELLPRIDDIKNQFPEFAIPAASELTANEKASLDKFVKKIRTEFEKEE